MIPGDLTADIVICGQPALLSEPQALFLLQRRSKLLKYLFLSSCRNMYIGIYCMKDQTKINTL